MNVVTRPALSMQGHDCAWVSGRTCNRYLEHIFESFGLFSSCIPLLSASECTVTTDLRYSESKLKASHYVPPKL